MLKGPSFVVGGGVEYYADHFVAIARRDLTLYKAVEVPVEKKPGQKETLEETEKVICAGSRFSSNFLGPTIDVALDKVDVVENDILWVLRNLA